MPRAKVNWLIIYPYKTEKQGKFCVAFRFLILLLQKHYPKTVKYFSKIFCMYLPLSNQKTRKILRGFPVSYFTPTETLP